ncbi:hypothetical protein AJ79_08172 [Helicocarpus griseus UAMH5409]|uniref:Auxiliary Activity family 9 catalytic domain-containing protein n=1 Tax=Helicocarpus griseus UAMH5409 TaxID=1447875 RepID=A0A2B7WVF0_9EURO|nr:hypothetical protein AJ79_08172 [Helicocarpus griseus UAMH5409]
MSVLRSAAFLGALASVALVDAHGTVTGILADGNYFGGYLNQYSYMDNPPAVAGWSTTATDNGFVDASAYSSPDIICHRGSEPGQATAEIAAGGTVELQWTEWPESHHGPVIDYLANCNGDCSAVDKTALEFFKIQESGLVDGSSAPGKWASDELIANNNTWTLKIPQSIAPGNYVLRHEIIALHSAQNENGAQNYPQCLNLKVTGGGSANPEGTLGTALYKEADPGIKVNIYTAMDGYTIPGPPLFADGGNTGGGEQGGDDGDDEGSNPTEPSSPAVSPTVTPTPTATPSPTSTGSTTGIQTTVTVTVTAECSPTPYSTFRKPHPREFVYKM